MNKKIENGSKKDNSKKEGLKNHKTNLKKNTSTLQVDVEKEENMKIVDTLMKRWFD